MRCSSQHMSCNQNIWCDNRSKNMLPSTGLLKYWLYPTLLVSAFAKNGFLFLHWWFTVLLSTEYFSCVLARSSLPLTTRTVHFIWYLANISVSLPVFPMSSSLPQLPSEFLIFTHPLPSFFLSMSSCCQPAVFTQASSSTRPFTPALMCLAWSKDLTLVAGNNHPTVENCDRPKKVSSIPGFHACSPSCFYSLLPFPALSLPYFQQGISQFWSFSVLIRISHINLAL